MARVAHAVGVRPPSLYKHVRDRGDLIRAIGNNAVGDLGARLTAASGSGDPRQDRDPASLQRSLEPVEDLSAEGIAKAVAFARDMRKAIDAA